MFLDIVLPGLLAALLAAGWEFVRLLNGASRSWGAVGGRFVTVLIVLLLAAWVARRRRGRWPRAVASLVLLCLVACWRGVGWADTRAAWIAVTALYATLLVLESAFAAAARERGGRLAWLEYGIGLLALAAIGGLLPLVLAQIESHFAEEEFFVAVQAAFLGLFALLLLLAQIVARRFVSSVIEEPFPLRPLWGALIGLLVAAGLAWWGVSAYQASFYAPAPPDYDGVSADAPFLCATLEPEPGGTSPQGQQAFQRMLDLVAANPRKGAPEYGMLALSTGERQWADAFRRAMLEEAEAGRFTEPANSVKYGQRQAAQRVYYYTLVDEVFPDLFSDREQATIKEWFAAVNRRAMTVEWVDWLYALAFSAWPEGPYENQENGAGLLALLESSHLGDGDLSAANQDYLAHNVRGWIQRFRNTDDAYLYQTEWIENALFQAGYQGRGPEPATFERNRRLAFEWLLLQSLPGGAPMTYNRPGASSVAPTLYLGALLLDDPRYLWVADQGFGVLETDKKRLFAQPGAEKVSLLTGVAPTQGTCLIFSPSGLPTQVGALSPDKVVFRDGWEAGDTYLLLNLRFTGWHRYKATNGIVMLYQDGPVVVEQGAGNDFSWLPTGRSLFRDKRIPRENLNGLLIPRSGFSQLVYLLSGLSGPWAQDPPHHARVEALFQFDLLDASLTTIEDWRGWRHGRAVYFISHGPVIVIDDVQGPVGGESALAWHLAGLGEQTDAGLWLRRGDAPLRVALPPESWRTTSIQAHDDESSESTWDLIYRSPESGRLNLVTAFMMNGWGEADYEVQALRRAGEVVGQYVHLRQGDQDIQLLHNALWRSQDDEPPAATTAAGLSTNGQALVVMGNTVCPLGGTQASFALPTEPQNLHLYQDMTPLQRGQDWEWADGALTLWPSFPSTCLVIDY